MHLARFDSSGIKPQVVRDFPSEAEPTGGASHSDSTNSIEVYEAIRASLDANSAGISERNERD
jgi:hypothetical protein